MLQLRCAAYPLMATKAAQHVYHIINAVTARLKIMVHPTNRVIKCG